MVKTTATLGASLALVLAAFGPVSSQDRQAALEGMVLDSATARPLAGVLIELDSGQRTKTDEFGQYRLSGIDPGEHRVAIVTRGCSVSIMALPFAPFEVQKAAFQVPSVIQEREPADASAKRSHGKFVTSEQIADMHVRTFFDLLRRVEPAMVGAPGNQPGSSTRVRGRTVTVSGPSPPVVVVDGVVLGSIAREVMDGINPGDIESLEIMSGATGGWEYGTGGAGGVIRIRTKRGNDASFRGLEPEQCQIPW